MWRFITEDTYGGKTTDPLSLNKYVYCADNPVMYTDPDGHSFFSKIAKHAKKFARKAAMYEKVIASGTDKRIHYKKIDKKYRNNKLIIVNSSILL